MNKYNSISPYYVHALLQGAIRQGYDVDALLCRYGLNLDLIKQHQTGCDKSRIETSKVSALIRDVWGLLDDEFMGFTDIPCKQGVFSIIAKQVINEQTLGNALKSASYLYSTIRNDIRLEFDEVPAGIRLSFQTLKPELDESYFLVEFFLLIWHRFSSWLVAERVPLKFVTFSYPSPEHVEEYSLLFPCHCQFNSDANALVFDYETMSLNVKQGAKELNQFLVNSPTDLLSKPDFQRSFTTQVMNLIQNEDKSFKSLEDLSNLFSMSPRNLRRRLSDENSSYVEIKQQLREERAISLLSDTSLTVGQIGQTLGFVEVAAFSRAFKNWTGLSPRLYRERYFINRLV